MGSFLVTKKQKKGGKTLDEIFKYSECDGEIIITGLRKDATETSIVIPETIDDMPVTAIADEAFKGSHIANVKIGENIKEIGGAAFSHCKNLKNVVWNTSCDISYSCFFDCPKLSKFDLSNVKKIGGCAFSESGIKKVELSENIEEVGWGAFF